MASGSDGTDFNFTAGSGSSDQSQQPPSINVTQMLQALVHQVEVLSDIVQDQRDAAVCKKPVQPLQFANKGNEIQYNINLSAINSMNRAMQYIQAGKAAKAIKLLTSCVDDLEKRNKCIMIAEQSDSGWTAVDFYLRPQLGSSDTDSQLIKQANTLARAALKRKHESDPPRQRNYRRGRGGGRSQPGYNQQGSYRGSGQYMQNMPFSPNSFPFGYNPMQQFQQFQAFQPGFWPQQFPTAPSNFPAFQQPSNGFRAPPQCYKCWQIGHVQKNCPASKQNPLSANVPYRQ